MQRAKDELRCPVVLFCGQQESAKEEEEEEEEEEEKGSKIHGIGLIRRNMGMKQFLSCCVFEI